MRFAIYTAISLYTCAAQAQSFRYDLPADRATLTELNTSWSVFGIDVNQPRGGGFASAIWHNAPVRVDSNWSTSIRFRITNTAGGNDPNGKNGGDGLAFVVQNWSPAPIGMQGYGLGYHGIRNALAVELDTWDDTGLITDAQSGLPDTNWIAGEDGSNHIAIHSNGQRAVSAIPAHSSVHRSASDLPDVSDGAWHDLSIRYRRIGDDGILECYVDDCESPRLTLRVRLDTLLALTNGTAYVGITGGTQMAYQRATVARWCFNGECGCAPCVSDTVVLTLRDTVERITVRVDTLWNQSPPDTVTVYVTRVDTVASVRYVYDTTIVTLLDSIFIAVHDTTVVDCDTVYIHHYDTLTITRVQDTCALDSTIRIDSTICGYVTRAYVTQPGVHLAIVPNPASSWCEVLVTAPGSWTAELFDANGIRCVRIEGDESATVAVDVGVFPSGAYTWRLICGDVVRLVRVVLRR